MAERHARPARSERREALRVRRSGDRAQSVPVDTGRGARIEHDLLRHAAQSPHAQAVVDRGREHSYADMARRSAALADDLRAAGVRPGDRVAVYLEKSVESVTALYGAWLAGGVVVPVNQTLKTPQVAHILQDSGSRALVSDERKLTALDTASLPDIPVLTADSAIQEHGETRMRDTLEGGSVPAAILYTSGSTGRPKGVLVSHANLMAGARIVSSYLELRAEDRLISIPPFSFDYGLNQLLTSMRQGATLVLQRSPFPADICRTLEDHAITVMAAVAPLWIQLAAQGSPFMQRAFPRLRLITNTGGAFPVDLVRRYRAHLPECRIYLMYGLSEAFRSTFLPPDQVDRRPGSIGKAIPETEIHVVNERGELCGAGEVGELVHKGPTVALGYWNDPESTARVFRASPMEGDRGETVVYSGDLVRRDEEGYLYFVSRRDAMIKTYGYRVSPEEVEELLLSSDLIQEAAVHGEPDEVSGAVIVAHVVPTSPGTFSSSDLRAHCRRVMPSYMVPREFRVHEALPRSANGKIDRKRVAT